MRMTGFAAASALAALSLTATLTAPAQGQSSDLSQGQLEFFSEVLAMGDVCGQLSNFAVDREEMQSWVALRLSEASDADLDTILANRDAKIGELEESVVAVQAMEQGFARRDASTEHFAGLVTRCNRLVQHSISGEYFRIDPRN